MYLIIYRKVIFLCNKLLSKYIWYGRIVFSQWINTMTNNFLKIPDDAEISDFKRNYTESSLILLFTAEKFVEDNKEKLKIGAVIYLQIAEVTSLFGYNVLNAYISLSKPQNCFEYIDIEIDIEMDSENLHMVLYFSLENMAIKYLDTRDSKEEIF